MHDNPRYEAYEVGSHRQTPEGTVARGSLDANPAAPKSAPQSATAQAATTPAAQQTLPAAPVAAGAVATAAASQVVPSGEEGFPFKVTKEILDRGESRFNITCLPCHGKLGDGDGMIVQRGFRRPPSYHTDRLRKAPASYIYDVITNGFGAMSNYADHLTPEDRWKVIAYVRALQLSQRAEANTLAEGDRKKLEEAEKKAAEKAAERPPARSSQTAPASTSGSSSGGHSN